eukprot:gene6318-7041_t
MPDEILPIHIRPLSLVTTTKEDGNELKRSSSKSKKISPRKKNVKQKSANVATPSVMDNATDDMSMTLPKLKGLLLSSAENIIKKLMSTLNEESRDGNDHGVTAESLQLLCRCETMLANVADMQMLPIAAARHIFKAMGMIDNALSFTQSLHSSEVVHTLMGGAKSLEHAEHSLLFNNPTVNIDVRLWLDCRLKISQYLSQCVKVRLEDGPLEAESVVGTASYHIEQGLVESDVLDDKELHAKFTMLEIYRSLHTGEEAVEIVETLQNLVTSLSSLSRLSRGCELLLTDAKVLTADLNAATGTVSSVQAGDSYTDILKDILRQSMYLGSNILPDELTFQRPLRNIYNDLLESFAAVKLRLGKCMATEAENIADVESLVNHWRDVNSCLSDALDVQRCSVRDSSSVEIEIIFIQGLIVRQLFELDKVSLKEAVESLIEVVKLSSRHAQDLSMLRQVYLELSLVLLLFHERSEAVYAKIEKQRQLEDSEKEKELRAAGSAKSSSNSNNSGVNKQTQQLLKAQQAKRDKETRIREKQRQAIRKAAWVAVRTAGAIAKAQKKIELLTADTVLMSDDAKELSAPDFSLYEIFRTDAIVRDAESGMIMNGSGLVVSETRSGKTGSFQFTWLHLVNYLKNLKRLTGYSTMGFRSGSKLGVRTAFNTSRTVMKLQIVHRYLQENFAMYDKECCPILPVDVFLGQYFLISPVPIVPIITVAAEPDDMESKKTDKVPPIEVTLETSRARSVSPREEDTIATATTGPKEQTEVPRSSSSQKLADRSNRIHARDPLQASELEVALQWHRSELFQDDVTTLLFATNNKAISVADKPASFAAFVVVSRMKVSLPAELRHTLMDLFRMAESDLNQTSGALSRTAVAIQAATTMMSTSPTRKKKPMGIKSIVLEQDREEQVRQQLKAVLDVLQAVFYKSEIQEVPFETTFANVACLEKLFNTNFGHLSKTTDAFFAWLSRLLN